VARAGAVSLPPALSGRAVVEGTRRGDGLFGKAVGWEGRKVAFPPPGCAGGVRSVGWNSGREACLVSAQIGSRGGAAAGMEELRRSPPGWTFLGDEEPCWRLVGAAGVCVLRPVR
jgi:hypothetical protein